MSSAELMLRYCHGDLGAFHELYTATAPRLRAYLRSMLRDDGWAEELLQQTFLKLHKVRGHYARGKDPLPWLYAIAYRVCIDETRRRRRARVRLVRNGEDSLPDMEASLDGTCVGAEASEPYSEIERSAVLRALDELPDPQRKALALTKIDGLTMLDAARVLGTTEGALKVRAHRAYARLRAVLARDECFQERLGAAAIRSQRLRQRRGSEVAA